MSGKGKGGRGKAAKGGKSVSRSAKAGLQFPVGPSSQRTVVQDDGDGVTLQSSERTVEKTR
jgi:hypothetical protein